MTLPSKMSQMDTRPLSHCGIFSKGASIFLKIWGVQQNQIAQFLLHQTLCFLCTNVFVNVTKICTCVLLSTMMKTFVCQFLSMRCCGGL